MRSFHCLPLSFIGEFYLRGRLEIAVPVVPGTQPIPDPCAAAGDHWKAADAIGSVAAFEDHLARFPDCTFAGLAKARIESLKQKLAVVAPPATPVAPPFAAAPPVVPPSSPSGVGAAANRGRTARHKWRCVLPQ